MRRTTASYSEVVAGNRQTANLTPLHFEEGMKMVKSIIFIKTLLNKLILGVCPLLELLWGKKSLLKPGKDLSLLDGLALQLQKSFSMKMVCMSLNSQMKKAFSKSSNEDHE